MNGQFQDLKQFQAYDVGADIFEGPVYVRCRNVGPCSQRTIFKVVVPVDAGAALS